jgi:hypothetical protein
MVKKRYGGVPYEGRPATLETGKPVVSGADISSGNTPATLMSSDAAVFLGGTARLV